MAWLCVCHPMTMRVDHPTSGLAANILSRHAEWRKTIGAARSRNAALAGSGTGIWIIVKLSMSTVLWPLSMTTRAIGTTDLTPRKNALPIEV